MISDFVKRWVGPVNDFIYRALPYVLISLCILITIIFLFKLKSQIFYMLKKDSAGNICTFKWIDYEVIRDAIDKFKKT